MGPIPKSPQVQLSQRRRSREKTPEPIMNANASRTGVNPNGTETSLLNRVSHSRHFSSTAKSQFLAALRYGPVKTARKLLKEIPIVAKTRDNRGYTPLHYAAMATLCDTAEMVKELRQAGANIDAEDISGNTPLHYSCPKMAAALIDMNANIEARNLQGSTALHLAANKGITEKVRILLTANANVEAQDNWQLNTPLHSAARAGYLEIVKMVLGKGANVNSVNKLGMTPLCLVASSFTLKPGLDKVVQLLLNANADMKIPDKDGNTPLHHAAMNENLEILRLLLNEGGDIHLANRKGVTVWDLAQRPGRREIKKVISQIIVKV
jgi:ankyrin repeat protein